MGPAEEFLQRSIALWHKLGEPVSQANAEDNLGRSLPETGQVGASSPDSGSGAGSSEWVRSGGRVQSLLSDIHEHLRTAEAASETSQP